jgi:hypothetical protein
MTAPKQLPLPLDGSADVPTSSSTLEQDRSSALEASARYLDTLEARARTMSGISLAELKASLADIARRRLRLHRLRGRDR